MLTDSQREALEPLGVTWLRSGKVRELLRYIPPSGGAEEIWLVSTDRVSAFDRILSPDIPHKGVVLTQMARHWFELTASFCPNHVIGYELPAEVVEVMPFWKGRTVRCQPVEIIPMECVARGYLTGSGWKQYQDSGSVCGIPLPEGLRESDALPELLFTPTTKADEGHDMPLTPDEARQLVGTGMYDTLSKLSRELFAFASSYAARRGILIADTKFEFGRDANGQIVLADEIFTPDSSRYWPADQYEPGRGQPSFDKQFVRDYLESIQWNKQPPVPELPADIIEQTQAKYLEALHRLAGTIDLDRVMA